jgi:uracil-DNA glycosylase
MSTQLDRLLAEIRACRACVDAPRGRPLPHEPRPVLRVGSSARLAVTGQAPGTRVHASGLPFNDPSGVRLRDWMGVSEAEFYDERRVAVVPMGFCFPGLDAKGGDLPPRRECAPLWRARLLALLPRVELVLLVGGYAQRWHLPEAAAAGLAATVADWEAILDRAGRPRYLPLPHPSWRNNAWLKVNPWFARELVPRLRREVDALIRPAREVGSRVSEQNHRTAD